MVAENIRIIVGSVGDPATLTATSEAMPVEGLQRGGRENYWRSTSLAAQTIIGTLADPQTVDGFALSRHNLGAGASFQLKLKLAGVTVYDSTAVSVNLIIPAGIWRAGIDPWAATYDDQLQVRVSKLWFDPVTFDSFELTLTDPANVDGYIQVGRLFLGLSIQPKINMSYGAKLSWIDKSRHIRTEGGGIRTEGGARYRRLSFKLDALDDDDRTRIEIDLGNVPKGFDCLVSAYPKQGGSKELTHTFVGRRMSDVELSHPYFETWSTTLVFEET